MAAMAEIVVMVMEMVTTMAETAAVTEKTDRTS
jgi:hypothetical protein